MREVQTTCTIKHLLGHCNEWLAKPYSAFEQNCFMFVYEAMEQIYEAEHDVDSYLLRTFECNENLGAKN